MDIQRYLLIGVMALISVMLLTEWNVFKEQHEEAELAKLAAESPRVAQQDTAALTDLTAPPPDSADVPRIQIPSESSNTRLIDNSSGDDYIRFNTDNFVGVIALTGGDITELALKKHKRKVDKDDPFSLLEQNSKRIYVAQSGLIGPDGTDTASGRAHYSTTATHYEMLNSDQELVINLHLAQDSGAQIVKRFTFRRDDYLIDVDYLINNVSTDPWQAAMFGQIKRDSTADPGSDSGPLGVKPFLGFATHTADEPYLKRSFEDIAEQSYEVRASNSWVAMVQHYFISAWIPAADQEDTISMLVSKSGMNIGRFTTALLQIAPGTEGRISAHFYAGPKDQYTLEKIASGLDLTVDYGWLWWIAQPLFALLHFFATGELHIFGQVINLGSGVGNWGWSIILLTVCVKLAFFHLSAASYKSMAKMRKLQPKMLELKERYGDDRQKMSQETMELYRKEKVNPLGGCLPILIQMPVFISLYWVLLESVELRHAPWALWINDLSVMDPFYVLPLIMGASMFFQQKLNPPPPDPMQARIFQLMPIMFTVFFLFFPAGLVLYWVVNNLLSIAQQYVITKRIENEGITHK